MDHAISFQDVVLEFGSGPSTVRALDGFDLDVPSGSVIGIVGESGSGKSTAGFVAGRLVPHGVRPAAGSLTVLGRSVWDLSLPELQELRMRDLRYIFQDAIASLDPTRRVATQLRDAAVDELDDAAVIAALEQVGLPSPERVARSYPYTLSGGMAQRVAIAMALVAKPKIIIADEATSALDASVRARILDLLRSIASDDVITMVLISHDLWAVRKFCDAIAVVYAGRVAEYGPTEEVFTDPKHPYTKALLSATVGHEQVGGTLATISGNHPVLRRAAPGCAFVDRCEFAVEACEHQRPQAVEVAPGWRVTCHLVEQPVGLS